MALLVVSDLNRVLVHTVEVHPCQRSAIVADNNTIWIQHWHEFKDKMVAETLWGKGWSKRGGEEEKEATEDFGSYWKLYYTAALVYMLWYLWYRRHTMYRCTDLGMSGVGGEALHHTLHHPTAVGLPGMHS